MRPRPRLHKGGQLRLVTGGDCAAALAREAPRHVQDGAIGICSLCADVRAAMSVASLDIGSQIARRSGLSDVQLLALSSYRTSALFSGVAAMLVIAVARPFGSPDPCAPPCIRQRLLPFTAGDRHGFPDRVLAPCDELGTASVLNDLLRSGAHLSESERQGKKLRPLARPLEDCAYLHRRP
jgi:hypothetical protein